MTALQKYNKCATWRGRVRVIYLYHCLMQAKNSSHTLRDTRAYFRLGLGTISEAIFLGDKLDKVKSIQKRRDAINYLKKAS